MATWLHGTPKSDERWGPLPPHATPARRYALRWLERLLLVIGLVCLGYFAYVSAESALYQAWETRELDAILTSVPEPLPGPQARPEAAPAPREAPRAPVRVPPPARGSAVGRIEIPRLGVSAVVRAGSDARTLRLAVGHVPGTALPGEDGNVGLAAHRDTFFRRLGEIRPDDEIRVVTPRGTFLYRVEGTQVVEPRDVWVLDPTERPTVTLITCYPFRYIGSAPNRFVVRAVLKTS
jgi:sortase A